MRIPTPSRRPAPRSDGRDAGMTLTEVVVSVGMLGLLTTVIAGAIVIVFRSEDGISNTVAESHDVQQAVNFFHLDVQSGPHDPADYRGSAAPDGGTGCSDAGDANVFRYDAGDRRVAYRLTVAGGVGELDRHDCRWDGSAWDEVAVVNIADSLDVSGTPVEVTVEDGNGDDEVDRVVMRLAQSSGTEEIAASPRAETGVAAANVGTCTDDPLEAALGFPGFVDGDVTLLGEDVLGPLAVGGTLAWTPGLNVSRTDKNQKYGGLALYVNEVDWSYPGTGTMSVQGGDVAIGGTFHHFTGPPRKGRIYESISGIGKYIDVKKTVTSLSSIGEIDFSLQFDDLKSCSNLLGELPSSCTAADCAFHVVPLDEHCSAPYPGSGEMCIDLGPKGAQVLNIPESELPDIPEFRHKGGLSQAHPLIVNVIDDDGDQHIDFTLSTGSWQNIGNTKNVLFNFPTVTTVTIDRPLYGTVLAPYAHLTTTGDVLGGVVAAEWTHLAGTVDNAGDNFFNGTIDWS